MKVGIIGAGFTGLSAAYYLAKSGHQVSVFERDDRPGGLAVGFQAPTWLWPLEQHYHHFFVSDWAIRNLSQEVGHEINFYRPKTSTWVNNQILQLDSPASLLKFNQLTLLDRLRTASGIALMRFNPIWQPFEYITAKKYITTVMGTRSWQVLWEPLFEGKFSDHAKVISAAWFWSRIYKRSPRLGYPVGGFLSLAKTIENSAKLLGVKFIYNSTVSQIYSSSYSKTSLTFANKSSLTFDKVICTLPTPLFSRITPQLPDSYRQQFASSNGLGAVNLVLSLKKSFLTNGTYWLNINDRKMPFLAIVEHTNFISSNYYHNEHILYIGNYLPSTHSYFNLSAQELLKVFLPYLKKINSQFSLKWVNDSWLWKAPFAQPIITTQYSKKIPPLSTPIPGIFLANIQQVYPWDRGTNYAVELGQRVSQLI